MMLVTAIVLLIRRGPSRVAGRVLDGDPRPSGGPPEVPPPDRVAELFARAAPEHKLAMLEARRWVPTADLGVSRARALLARVDTLYAEDAPRIVEVVELFWRAIRAEGQEASPLEMLEGATTWRDPA